MTRSFIKGLLACCCPAAIAFLVIAVYINSVNAHADRKGKALSDVDADEVPA